MQTYYQSDLQALGNNTAPVSQVVWISPDASGMAQGLVALQAGPTPAPTGNWAGYVAETNLGSPASGAVTMVSGDWTVPKVSGIPGASMTCGLASTARARARPSNRSARQDTWTAGKPKYYAWYQMRPARR